MQSIGSRPALIVFGKNPVPGQVKTRLARSIGEDRAAMLYRAFLLDSLDSLGTLDVDVRLYLAPSRDAVDPRVEAACPNYLLQSGNGLGERMSNAFRDLFKAGYDVVGIVGTDHPTLPVEILNRGFSKLRAGTRAGTVVLGPSEDGGYYFLALDRHRPELFSDIQFGTSDVLDSTTRKAGMSGARTILLDEWYDVDTILDLRKLASDLRTDPHLCPRTRDIMKDLEIF